MPVRVAIEARAAAEVPAGRGRFVREVVSRMARASGDFELSLYGRRAWSFPDPQHRVRWVRVEGRARLWPVVAGRRAGRRADVTLATSSYLFAVASDAPSVSVVYDLIPFHHGLGAPVGSALERISLPLAVRRTRSFVAISEATARELEQRFPTVGGRVRVAPLGVGPAYIPQSQSGDADVLGRHGLTRPYVLVTGTLEPRKNLARVAQAFAALPEDRPEVLVLVGPRGWGVDVALERVAALGKRARILGYVAEEELPALYRGAATFCYASLYEGFGLPVAEALACGTPTVTSSTSSMPEVGGTAAIYVDPHDAGDIRRGLLEALAQPAPEGVGRRVEQAAQFRWEETARIVLDEVLAAAGP